MILGLDISTSVTGIALVDINGKLMYYEAVDTRNPKKFNDVFDKAVEIKKILASIKNKYNIEKIYIEQSLQMFQSGMSSAKTLSVLSKFNGIVSWLCFYIFNIKPDYISAASARKINNVKISKGDKAKGKVMQYLLDNEPSFTIEYTPKGNIKPYYYDIADAIIIARAGQIKCQAELIK